VHHDLTPVRIHYSAALILSAACNLSARPPAIVSWGLAAAALALAALLLGCPPSLVEREGHRVFNPFYLFYLEANSREEWQKPELVLDALDLAPDAVVADIGAGGGYFTERFARRLARGLVYATDVQPVMLERLHERVDDHELANVVVITGRFDDPALPLACCDLVFFSSVYKELDARVAYMGKVRALLRPDGRVAILEFRPRAPGPGPPDPDRLPPERVIEELAAAGFELRAQHDFLPRQYFLVFAPLRTAAPGLKPPRY
jgi:ubiquinone/menaquinone biosynthesis C-methylase UbiE